MIRFSFRRGAVAALVLLGASAAVVGCGDDDDVPVAGRTGEAPVTETTTDPTDGGPVTGADGAPPPADAVVTEATPFASVTSNIGCVIEPLSVRCDIAERDWEPPPKPADCELDYGQGVILQAGGTADLVCAGDTTLGSGGSEAALPELPYGESIAAGLLRCESRRSGMRCRDVETGRGFALSREGYELF